MSLYSKFLGFGINWDLEWDLLNSKDDEAAIQEAREVDKKLSERSLAIFYHIERALKAVRCHHLTNGRTIKHSAILLTKNPSDVLDVHMDTSLFADVAYDPVEFSDLPDDHRVIGEAWLECIEEGLGILSKYPDYPVEVVRTACNTFRENDYTLKLFSPKPTTITGTKLKGRIDTYIDAISLRRDLTVAYRGKELLTKTISRFDRIDVANSAEHNSIELNGRTLTFRPLSQDEYDWWLEISGPYDFRDPVDLDLNEFPEALAFVVEKGWAS